MLETKSRRWNTSVRVPARWASTKSLPRQLPSSVLTWTHWLYPSITCSCQLLYSWFVFSRKHETTYTKNCWSANEIAVTVFLKMYFLCMCCCSHGEIFWVAMIIFSQQFPRSKAEVQAATEAVTKEASQVELLSEIVLENMHIIIRVFKYKCMYSVYV